MSAGTANRTAHHFFFFRPLAHSLKIRPNAVVPFVPEERGRGPVLRPRRRRRTLGGGASPPQEPRRGRRGRRRDEGHRYVLADRTGCSNYFWPLLLATHYDQVLSTFLASTNILFQSTAISYYMYSQTSSSLP